MVTIIIVAVVAAGLGYAVGHGFGRSTEQKVVAAALMDFGKVDADAKSLVNRCYAHLSDGLKAELKKLGL